LKYAIASAQDVDVNCISRPNEPDFSDLFAMTDGQYRQMMMEWAASLAMQLDPNNISREDFSTKRVDLRRKSVDDYNQSEYSEENPYDYNSTGYPNDVNDYNYAATDVNDANDSNELYVKGPYGPPWPYITKPIEIEFGNAKLTIELIDENAKLPLVWAMTNDPNSKEEAQAAFVTFCEWMQMKQSEIQPILEEFEQIKEVKPFNIALKPVTTTTKEAVDPNTQNPATGRAARRISRLRQRGRVREKIVQQTRPESAHILDFAKILHSPMVDLETLAKPVNYSETRPESALKYISLWGTQKVNINTAPRQVLEAAFTYGGDAPDIAQKIIDERRIKPFTGIDDFKKRLVSYTASILKCEPYITTESDFYSIRVKATSGVARVCATAGIKKEKQKIVPIGIIIE
jgi:DNA uptake protein ComE-like DNA-binding protein